MKSNGDDKVVFKVAQRVLAKLAEPLAVKRLDINIIIAFAARHHRDSSAFPLFFRQKNYFDRFIFLSDRSSSHSLSVNGSNLISYVTRPYRPL